MLLNKTLLIIKQKVVDIPLIHKYIQNKFTKKDALRMYNDTVGHKSFGRHKLTLIEFDNMWEYLK